MKLCKYQVILTFKIHMKRKPNACSINNVFVDGLQVWEANIDIQPVFNRYKSASYLCAHFSKVEDEISVAMKKATKETLSRKVEINYTMKK